MVSDIVERIDNLLIYIDGINDERDSVPLLIEVRKAWPQVKAEVERLRALISDCPVCSDLERMRTKQGPRPPGEHGDA